MVIGVMVADWVPRYCYHLDCDDRAMVVITIKLKNWAFLQDYVLCKDTASYISHQF